MSGPGISAFNTMTQAADLLKGSQQEPNVNISDLAWRLVKNVLLIVARFYIMIILVVYEWTKKLITAVLTPFDPVFAQVRKVPKTDVSLNGIFYQVLRLQFLIFLYLTPFLRSCLAYFTEPLTRFKSWADDFVGFEEKTRKVDAQE